MNVRRVVTGHDASGKSMFVSDEAVAPQPHTGFHRLWGGDETPQFPDDGIMPDIHMYFPPIGGFRFGGREYTRRAPKICHQQEQKKRHTPEDQALNFAPQRQVFDDGF